MRHRLSPELVVCGRELSRPRMTVERERIASQFSQFHFYMKGGRVAYVAGMLRTNYGPLYWVQVDIRPGYPYSMPRVSLPHHRIEPDCPHKYSPHEICVMKPERWCSVLTIAFIVARAAIWTSKYQNWLRSGPPGQRRWPGKDAHR